MKTNLLSLSSIVAASAVLVTATVGVAASGVAYTVVGVLAIFALAVPPDDITPMPIPPEPLFLSTAHQDTILGRITFEAKSRIGRALKPFRRPVAPKPFLNIGSNARVMPFFNSGPVPGSPKLGTNGSSCISRPMPCPVYSRITENPRPSA